ncbi:dicarboxylate/amino acid:cation symporter [Aspergillus mulundensis]|uniref:Amino acid transporter n=1 Tax=Aspergillus mulundensis TaxID=1810919 RepID=A0A3D8SBN6_9EURO|nr:Amino acid transporter [Aspergillus mulundensis]RDW83591.1 Amino acid transporter [Aspergillus mulundensis]
MEKSSGVSAHSGRPDSPQEYTVQQTSTADSTQPKKPWWHAIKEPGSALQIVTAAAIAIAIGLAVSSTVDDIPYAAPTIIEIPGALWLRALRAAGAFPIHSPVLPGCTNRDALVLPMIVTSMILAVQRLRELSNGGHILARWTIGYYVLTTLFAIVHSIILTSLVWRRLMTQASSESLNVDEEDQETFAEREETDISDVVVQMFESLIPLNIVDALATDSLLAVLVTAVVVGYMIDRRHSYILKAVEEVEGIIMKIIMVLIKLAPIGVFFLILPNMFRLDVRDIGQNLGVLIGGSLCNLALHLFIVLPALYFIVTRRMPYTFWLRCSPAWTTAWGTASSAATLPLSLKVVRASGVSNTVSKFTVPLGCLVNMDGTAIYFPLCVVFLAETQGHSLSPADYVIICLLSTLASIGTTPIPSSSLVLTVMIAGSVDVPITGMYAVIIAIDWFIDRFRTMTNVSGDLYAAAIIEKLSGLHDDESDEGEDGGVEGGERVV